jgi:hypothetical protein
MISVPWLTRPGGLLATAMMVTACGLGDSLDSASAGDEPRREVLAPIEEAELLVQGNTQPPSYAVRIVSGLPSGCARFERIDLRREDARIELVVWNSLPADDEIACTMIYATTENRVELGSDFEPDRSYAVHINGEQAITFSGR